MDINTEQFERKSIPQAFVSLTIPTIIGMLVILVYSLADTFFVGLTNNPDAVAAVALTYPLLIAFKALAALFGIGGGSMISRCLGVHNRARAKAVASCSFYFALISALVFSVLIYIFRQPLIMMLGSDDNTYALTFEYIFWMAVIGGVPTILSMTLAHLIRAEGKAKVSGIGVSMGGLLNIAFDPLFMFVIFPPGKEIMGAAIATMISNSISALYFIANMLKNRSVSVVSCRISDFRPSFSIISGIAQTGLPAALQSMLSVISNIYLNRLVGQAAAMCCPGTASAAFSATGIAKKLDLLPMDVTLGISQGILPFLAYNYSSGNYERMKNMERFSIKVAIAFSCICIAVFELFAPLLISLFIDDAQTIAYGVAFLRRICIATPFMAIGYLLISMFQAAGQGKQALALSIVRKGIVDVPVMFLMNAIIPLYGLFLVQPIVDIAAAILAFTMYIRFFKKLQSNVTRFSQIT